MNQNQTTIATRLIQSLKIDDPETIERYGEPITFYCSTKSSVDILMKLSRLRTTTIDHKELLLEIAKLIILDNNGNPAITDGMALPYDIMYKALHKVIDFYQYNK